MTPSRALLLGAFLPLTVLFLGAGQKLREEVRAALDRGLAAYQRGELDAAIESFETALSAEPENVRARFNLARALHQAGKGERALQELLGLEGRMQDRARYLSLLGQIYADSERFAELGLRDDTLLVLTSDHGEGLGDHGETLHGFFVYQLTLAVPLLFRGPRRRSGYASLCYGPHRRFVSHDPRLGRRHYPAGAPTIGPQPRRSASGPGRAG